jgi:Zn-dependent protease with chaperone function
MAQEGSFRSNPLEDAYTENSSRHVQLAKISFVGDRIVQSGKSFVNDKIKHVIANHMKQQDTAVSQEELQGSLSQDVEFMKWTEAKERMDNSGEKWKFVLVESPVPNACVSELVPCTIFVTTSLLNTFTTNDDELALILGHEVVSNNVQGSYILHTYIYAFICHEVSTCAYGLVSSTIQSHLIHGHGSEAIDTETFLKTMEVLMLSLDPTEGFLSVLIIGAISILHRFLSASYSQHHELEADEMGIALAARACFNTRIAPLTFKKMHQHHLESSNRELYGSVDTNNRRGISDFLSTHPPSLERYENLTLASLEENPEKYAQTHCGKIKKGFMDSLLLRRKETEQQHEN